MKTYSSIVARSIVQKGLAANYLDLDCPLDAASANLRRPLTDLEFNTDHQQVSVCTWHDTLDHRLSGLQNNNQIFVFIVSRLAHAGGPRDAERADIKGDRESLWDI